MLRVILPQTYLGLLMFLLKVVSVNMCSLFNQHHVSVVSVIVRYMVRLKTSDINYARGILNYYSINTLF